MKSVEGGLSDVDQLQEPFFRLQNTCIISSWLKGKMPPIVYSVEFALDIFRFQPFDSQRSDHCTLLR